MSGDPEETEETEEPEAPATVTLEVQDVTVVVDTQTDE